MTKAETKKEGPPKITPTSAKGIFGDFPGIAFESQTVEGKAGGKVTIGTEHESWTWDSNGHIPRSSGVMTWIGERCEAFQLKYKTGKKATKSGGKAGGKAGTTAASTTASTTTTATRATKTQAAYWHGYTVEVLDQITSAIAEAKATAKQRQRAETARRTVEGLEELGLPVSEDLRALAGKAEPAAAEVAAPKTEGETPTGKAETGF